MRFFVSCPRILRGSAKRKTLAFWRVFLAFFHKQGLEGQGNSLANANGFANEVAKNSSLLLEFLANGS